MAVLETAIQGLYLVQWTRFPDERGFFKHSYQLHELEEAVGRPVLLRQGNHSRSHPGVLRGFHAEPWDKLIYVVRGRARCVVADVRPDSPTFGTHVAFELGDEPGAYDRIFVEQGLANAFYAYDEVDYLNDVSREFDPSDRNGFAWNDPTLAIEWPTDSPILSEADAHLPTLRERFPAHPLFG
jgi:dTDP-4-dehydrorhamnose 3,5-epimerase